MTEKRMRDVSPFVSFVIRNDGTALTAVWLVAFVALSTGPVLNRKFAGTTICGADDAVVADACIDEPPCATSCG